MEQSTTKFLIGVLLTNALVIRRGERWIVMNCYCQPTHTQTVAGMLSTQVDNHCSQSCMMFQEPVYHEDGSAELTICQGRVLKFFRLVDFRGELPSVDEVTRMNDEDIFRELQEAKILQ